MRVIAPGCRVMLVLQVRQFPELRIAADVLIVPCNGHRVTEPRYTRVSTSDELAKARLELQ